MSDFELLKCLQNELIATLIKRKAQTGILPRDCCKTKIRRLRLQIQEVMLRIENRCEGYIKYDKELWEE